MIAQPIGKGGIFGGAQASCAPPDAIEEVKRTMRAGLRIEDPRPVCDTDARVCLHGGDDESPMIEAAIFREFGGVRPQKCRVRRSVFECVPRAVRPHGAFQGIQAPDFA